MFIITYVNYYKGNQKMKLEINEKESLILWELLSKHTISDDIKEKDYIEVNMLFAKVVFIANTFSDILEEEETALTIFEELMH